MRNVQTTTESHQESFRLTLWNQSFQAALDKASQTVQEFPRKFRNDREVYALESELLGPVFLKLAKGRFPKAVHWHEDIARDAGLAYFESRCKGFPAMPSRKKQASAMGDAKRMAWTMWATYSGVIREYWRSYKAKDQCSCSECGRGRVYNCLNGTFDVSPPVFVDLWSPVQGINGDSVPLWEILSTETPNKYREMWFLKEQIRRLFQSCETSLQRRIVAGRLKGLPSAAIGRKIGKSREMVHYHMTQVVNRFQA